MLFLPVYGGCALGPDQAHASHSPAPAQTGETEILAVACRPGPLKGHTLPHLLLEASYLRECVLKDLDMLCLLLLPVGGACSPLNMNNMKVNTSNLPIALNASCPPRTLPACPSLRQRSEECDSTLGAHAVTACCV